MGDGNENETEKKVSDKFLKNIDDIKQRIKDNYKSESSVDSEEVRDLIKRTPGRKKNEVNDAIENIGTDVSSSSLVLKFKKNVDIDSIEKAGRSNDEDERKRVRRRFGHSKLMKFVFHDAFGNKCGVFYNPKSRKFLEKMLDIQINCIYDISNADGMLWKVVGVVEDSRYYLKYHYFDVGYISCVGISNAIILGNLLCERNNCKLCDIKFVSAERI